MKNKIELQLKWINSILLYYYITVRFLDGLKRHKTILWNTCYNNYWETLN